MSRALLAQRGRTGRAGRARVVGVGLALLASVSGCAAAFRCPEQGGPAWRELASDHFSLSTDLDSEEAREAVRDLEDFRAMLIATAWPRLRAPGGACGW